MERAKRHQARYTNGDRKALLQAFHASGTSERQFCRERRIPRATWQGWRSKEASIMANKRHGRHATMGGQGHQGIIPFKDELLAYMRAKRADEDHLRVYHLMSWVRRHKKEWLMDYLSTKTNEARAYQALSLLLLRFAGRYRFRHRVPCVSKVNQQVLDDVWTGYAVDFWNKYSEYPPSQILNVDETGVHYDMPPGRTLAEVGKSSKCKTSEKHSERVTAVLTIRMDGVKLPILFIVKGKPGGSIEKNELATYPPGHAYAVQENAWMCDRVWSYYLKTVLKPRVEDASVLLVDNLDCHVSDASKDEVAEAMFSVVEPLPPNSTSRCQPLDVGVMGPLKAMLKTAWLMEDEERDGDELTSREKRLAIIKRTIGVWDRISPDTVKKSFDKAIPSVIEL